MEDETERSEVHLPYLAYSRWREQCLLCENMRQRKLGGEEAMAEIEKHNDAAMIMLLKHSERRLKNDSNTDIAPSRTCLNYSLDLGHEDVTDIEYYQRLVGDSYLYGRGTKREAEAVTCCSWVITLPKEISDYSSTDIEEPVRLHPEEEKMFFEGALDFVSNRYGIENIVHAKVHYDEGGQPHVHIYFVPRKELDHDQVHYKTVSTKKAVQTDTGRWEYSFRYKTDDNGDRIKLKNYSKMSDYYDYKLAASEIVNPVELKHFHPDFARYLKEHNLPGASFVHTGITGGNNVSVSSLKELTRATGMTLEQVQALQREKSVLEQKIITLEQELSAARQELQNITRNVSNEWGSVTGWGQTQGWGNPEVERSAWNLDQ